MAQSTTSTTVFWQEGFPAADTATPDHAELAALPDSHFANVEELTGSLASADTKLLVLPYGSAFPEQAWPAIYAYLQRGGNLLTLGGRPFSRAVYRECDASQVCRWKMRYPRNAWSKALYINDYTETPGSKGLQQQSNPDLPEVRLPAISWKRAWSPTVRMSAEGLYPRIGTAGTIDMRLDTIVWGVDSAHKLAAPVIQLDHIKNNFVGGRWVMVPAELGDPLPAGVVTVLAQRALAGAQEITVQPQWALFLPGEAPSFEVRVNQFAGQAGSPAPRAERQCRERTAGDAIVSAGDQAVSVHQQRAVTRAITRRPAHGDGAIPKRRQVNRTVSDRLLGTR